MLQNSSMFLLLFMLCHLIFLEVILFSINNVSCHFYFKHKWFGGMIIQTMFVIVVDRRLLRVSYGAMQLEELLHQIGVSLLVNYLIEKAINYSSFVKFCNVHPKFVLIFFILLN